MNLEEKGYQCGLEQRLEQCKKDIAVLEENKRTLEAELGQEKWSVMLADFEIWNTKSLRVLIKREIIENTLKKFPNGAFDYFVFDKMGLANWFTDETIKNQTTYTNIRLL